VSDEEKKQQRAAPPRPNARAGVSTKTTRAVAPSDRPTPRSTVIPRIPPLAPVRAKLETLIFHGAPPVVAPPSRPTPVAATAPASPMMLPPPLTAPFTASFTASFEDVPSAELLDDADLLVEAERDTPHYERDEHGMARTERPPPIVDPIGTRASRRRRRARFVAAVAAGLAAPIALAAFLFDGAPHKAHEAHIAAAPAAIATVAPGASRAPGTCVVEGAPKLLARRALVRGGVEAAALDSRLAFATLTSAKSGTALELDAQTLDVKSSAKIVAAEPLSHVVPELEEGAPIEAESDSHGLRTIADADGEAAFGAQDGYAVWSAHEGEAATRLWKLPWPQSIEAARVDTLGATGDRAVVFRRAGAIWIGSFQGGKPTSDLTKLSTSAYAGSPALDASGEEAVVAWAQREEQSSWSIRWTRWTPHAGPGAVHALELPPGGPGDRAMAPSVAAMTEGRFLLAWTEAGRGRNQVRAQVIDAADRPSGDPLLVSPPDAVAGQESIALGDSGRGAIAYFVARRGAFELRASAIDCR
jgi:hypothetical protein